MLFEYMSSADSHIFKFKLIENNRKIWKSLNIIYLFRKKKIIKEVFLQNGIMIFTAYTSHLHVDADPRLNLRSNFSKFVLSFTKLIKLCR